MKGLDLGSMHMLWDDDRLRGELDQPGSFFQAKGLRRQNWRSSSELIRGDTPEVFWHLGTSNSPGDERVSGHNVVLIVQTRSMYPLALQQQA